MKASEQEAHEAADRIAERYADEDTARLTAFIAEEKECDRKMLEILEAENAAMVRTIEELGEIL